MVFNGPLCPGVPIALCRNRRPQSPSSDFLGVGIFGQVLEDLVAETFVDLLDRNAGLVIIDIVDPVPHPEDVPGFDLQVGGLSLENAVEDLAVPDDGLADLLSHAAPILREIGDASDIVCWLFWHLEAFPDH